MYNKQKGLQTTDGDADRQKKTEKKEKRFSVASQIQY
jgi:hypothetical protein